MKRHKPSGASVALDELPAELRAELATKRSARPLRVRRQRPAFPKDDVRRYALRCLAVLADLAPSERRRVLEHALKVNAL